ncbi:MAG: NAD-dependent epimerase/dehydratase family protein [Dehalococcoidia bacterium]|nr:NAD-dependent epimerase/dehydratase family protein [Dehalococcoidia bacterium]
MTRVTVTGGAGFIGSHLAAALVAAGDKVTVLDNLHRGRREFVPAGATFLEGDIRDPAAVERAVAGSEVVYHLAAQSNVMGAMGDIDYSFESNVVGTFNVLKAAARAGVRRVVFASSREVYGEPPALPVREDAPLNAKNPYGASKLAGEAYCRAWTSFGDVDVYVLRFANVYGPGDTGRVIPLWLERAHAGQPLQVFGGAQVLDFVPVTTAVQAFRAAATAPNRGPVNVGTGQGTPLPELAERILALTGHRSAIEQLPARGAEVVRFVADVTRMREVLGVEPPAHSLCDLPELACQPPAG